jgi:chloramphenicol-sensitive protein RarD
VNKGIYYAVGAYALWGLLPVYWKLLNHVPVMQLLSHRIVWSFVTIMVVILLSRQWTMFRKAISNRRVLGIYVVTALLVGVNWLIYVWAVQHGFVVETSLGYFINPLISVLMGVIFLRERLRIGQWAPIGIATLGVLYLTFSYGSLPWISLSLAFTWATYALVKKLAPLSSLYGLALETAVLLLPAFFYLLFLEGKSQGVFLHEAPTSDLLLIGTGIATTVPLLLFALAVVRIPLSLTGILQYIAPTIQFLLGVFVFKEGFSRSQFIGFSLVWLALILFAVEGLITLRTRQIAAKSN